MKTQGEGRGLTGEYFQSRGMNKKHRKSFEREDAALDFDFGIYSPGEGITSDQFLDAIPELGGDGTMLDNTTIIWTNELGKGNSHTLDNIPFVFVGGGLGFKTGQAMQFDNVPHNRLWLSVAHAFGHPIETFGKADFSQGGPLSLS